MLLDIIFYGFIFYVVYQLIQAWITVNKIKSSVKEAVEIIEEHSTYKMLMFERIEQNGHNVVLCYDSDNNFIAQGTSKEEVIESAKKRYPNQNLATHKLEEFQWIKPKSESNSTNG